MTELVKRFMENASKQIPWPRSMNTTGGVLRRKSEEYVKFVVLGRSRTGSNFLRGLLNSCSGALVLGEIFKNPDAIEWGTDFQSPPEHALRTYQTDPVSFLDQFVFDAKPHWVKAFGFKLFYYHAQNAPWDRIWPYLRDQNDIHVLHVKRRNILRTHLSRARAMKTGNWVRLTDERQNLPAIQLDYEDCLADFEQTRRWEERYDQFFNGRSTLTVYYEDLALDYQAEMLRIQQFLHLPEEQIEPQTYKQSDDSIDRAIANFKELREKFSGTEWEEFFVLDKER